MKPKLFLITGVSGVGKTTVIPYLRSLLPPDFEVHDFDERGVPDNASHDWRLKETSHWINLGKQKFNEGISVIVCGFFNPDEMKEDFSDIDVRVILLDGDASFIEQRLRGRNANAAVRADLERAVGSAETFIENNTRFIPILREICKRHGCVSIDTTHLSKEAVAERISEHIKQNII